MAFVSQSYIVGKRIKGSATFVKRLSKMSYRKQLKTYLTSSTFGELYTAVHDPWLMAFAAQYFMTNGDNYGCACQNDTCQWYKRLSKVTLSPNSMACYWHKQSWLPMPYFLASSCVSLGQSIESTRLREYELCSSCYIQKVSIARLQSLQDVGTAKTLAFNKDVRTRCITLEGDDFNPGGTLTGLFPDSSHHCIGHMKWSRAINFGMTSPNIAKSLAALMLAFGGLLA